MLQKHLVLFAVVITGLVAGFLVTPIAYTNDNDPPSGSRIEFARQVSALMLNELLAALVQEFNETTPQNVEHGKQAISLLFNDNNRDMRLVSAFRPMLGRNNNRPSDTFERTALNEQPHSAVEEINDTWYY